MMINDTFLCFELFFGQEKQFEDVTFGLWETEKGIFLHIFHISWKNNSENNHQINQ